MAKAKTPAPTTIPVLYILMRNDLESMNAGKGMAQASHAANAFTWDHGNDGKPDVDGWIESTPQNFGTVLVLAVNEKQMRTAVDIAGKVNLLADIIHDPTYPIRDGETTHFIPMDTCAYVFAPDKDDVLVKMILGNFPLHP